MIDFLKRAPASVVITVTATVGIIILSVIIGFTVLSALGADTTEFSRFANSLMNAVGLVISAGGGLAAVAAARTSARTEDQTNGVLSKRVPDVAEQAADRAIAKMRDADGR